MRRVPSGDQASSPKPSSRSASVTTSPGIDTGATWSVPLRFPSLSSDRRLVNARRRPSGAHTGPLSPCSPEVNWYGAEEPSAAASQIALRYLFASRSTRLTT